MKYKSICTPDPVIGQVFTDKKAVVPNQALTLEEILKRFTRGEPLEIGREGAQYDDGEEDLEKCKNMDLVDKQEYIDKLKRTQKDFEKQEKAREKKRLAEIDRLAVEKLAGDKKAAEIAAQNAKSNT